MTKESDIQKKIFDHCTTLALRYFIFFFSIPNESLMTALSMFGVDGKTKAMLVNHFKKMGMVPGVPDFCFLYDNKTIFFEIKKPGEKPGDIQKRIHGKIRETGHQIFVIESLEEFIEIMLSMGLV